MKKKIFKSLLGGFIGLGLIVGLASCTIEGSSDSSNSSSSDEIEEIDSSEVITDEDTDTSYDEDSAVSIDAAQTITEAGTYTITGDIDGSIIIDASKCEVTLVLDNANITSSAFAGIYVKKASHVYINLVGENTVTSTGTTFTQVDDNSVDGAIFSKGDLTIKGDGSLSVTSSLHGIVAKDSLVITSTVEVKAVKKGISVNDYLATKGANINITSTTDGINVDNDDTSLGYIVCDDTNITITTTHDAMQASGTIQLTGGDYVLTTTKSSTTDESQKGIKAEGNIILALETATITTIDDAIHSNSNVGITSGEYIISSGDDGIHADNNLIIDGGTITISKSYEGLEGKTVTINDGVISIVSSDDGINAAGGSDSSSLNRPGANNFSSASSDVYININGGTITINASGDGVDSNGNINVTGGTTIVYGPTNNGDGALDYDGSASITGGVFIAIGYSGMAENFSTATQGSILYNSSSNYSASTTITIKSSDGTTMYSVTSPKSFNSVLISMPSLSKGSTYTLSIGSTSTTISLSSYLYSNGSSQGGNMGGNNGGSTRPGGR